MANLPAFMRRDVTLDPDHIDRRLGSIQELDPASTFMTPLKGADPRDYAPRTQRMSEAAAESKQHMLDLEAQLNTVRIERDSALVRVQLLEGANEMLHDDLTTAKNGEAYFRDRCVRLLSILELIASSALKGIKDDKPQVLVDAHQAAKEHRQNEPEAIAKAASISLADELKSLATLRSDQPAEKEPST